MNVLLKVSGSISAYKICGVVSGLVKIGYSVKIAASRSSLEFVGTATWEGLSGNKVFLDDFTPGERMNHIHLNDWADVVVLAPASAQTLNSLSNGVGAGVLTTLFLARDEEKPYLIFPAMNPKMWTAPSVQKSVENLKAQKSIEIFNPSEGLMACGHKGVGRLKETSFILDVILKKERHKKSVLVTFGGTAEDIDGVRMITNFSSGKTGIKICSHLRKSYNVTGLGSKEALKGSEDIEGVEIISFTSSIDLSDKIKKELKDKHYDLVVHAAAVSDFIPVQSKDQKISSNEDFNLNFTKAPKILNELKKWSKNKNIKVVSFKLTHNQKPEVVFEKIKKQLEGSISDFVVHNELSSIQIDRHEYSIWTGDKIEPILKGETKDNMAKDIGGL